MRFLENVFLGCFGIKDAYRELNEREREPGLGRADDEGR